jgi:branched-chain amino acid transport system permease protein
MNAGTKRIFWLIAAALLIWGGELVHANVNGYYQDILQRCGIAIIMAVSLNIVNGLTGQFAIGHAGFMAVGAYTGAGISYQVGQHLSHGAAPTLPLMIVAMFGGGLVAAAFGYAVGVPSLRLRGDYLAIVTLGFGEIIRVLLENTDELAPGLHLGGATGMADAPQLVHSSLLFPLILGSVILVIVLSRNLKFSSHGLAFLSVREDEVAADAMGVNITNIKVTAFVLSAFFAGVGGAIYAHSYFISPAVFNFILSMNFVVMIVMGGTGSITGATMAAVAVTLLPELLKPVRDRFHFDDVYIQVVFALSLVILMIVRPSGVFGTGEISFRKRRSANELPDNIPTASRHSGTHTSPSSTSERGAVLEADGLTRTFGGLTAVGNVNIRLDEGELVGLIGPNGAGKTTFFNLLTGVYEPSGGRLNFLGKTLAGVLSNPPAKRTARLVWDGALFVVGGWIIGTIMSTVLTPYAVTASDLRIQMVVKWGCILAGLFAAVITAPNRRRFAPGLKPYQFAARGISRTFQNIRLFGELTVLDNVSIGTYLRRRTNLFDALFSTPRLKREEAENIAHARDLLARFNLTRFENELAKNLPYGDQRRLEIVRALATDPKLLLLDEPAAGMNPQEKAGLMALIRQIRDDYSLTILLIEHDMTLVMGICERIYVLDYGVIIADGTPEEIRSNPKVIAAYLGEDTDDEPDSTSESVVAAIPGGSPAPT